MQQPASEIDKAIEMLIALKSARPASFDEAMRRIDSAPSAGSGDDSVHASSLALGLLKGPFGRDSSGMFMEMSAKLPRMPGGALGLASKSGGDPQSLVSRALRSHGLASPWIRFFMQSIRDGKLPVDKDCAFDLACRLQETADDGEDRPGWLGAPDSFHEALGAFFSWDCDWGVLSEQARMDFLPWILQYWLHEGGPASFESALCSCRSLMDGGAAQGLAPASWLEFARPTHSEHAQASLEAMAQCLLLSLGSIRDAGLGPCLMFCKQAYPTPWMAQALRKAIAIDPLGPTQVDAEGLSCPYFINQRITDHESSDWQHPLLDCFHALLDAGADPCLIAPQLALSSIARHPRIAAAVEAAQIESQTFAGASGSSERL